MVHLPDRDSGPKFIKDFQIGPVAKGACGTLPDQARERKPSNAWARKIPALTRPIKAVTVSIMATVRYPQPRQND
jgi:hypothetical protein